MNCNIKSICLSATLCTVASFAQVAVTQTTSSTVAYVYVSNILTGTTSEVHAYAATKNGKLTPVDGSPFSADVTNMAVNGKYLFGSSSNGTSVDSYFIESDGALRFAASNNIVNSNYNGCGFSGPIFFDHTGATLYDMEFQGDCSNNMYQSLKVGKSTGHVQNLL